MQIEKFDIIFPWDSVNCDYTWEQTGEVQYVEIKQPHQPFNIVECYSSDIISLLMTYIVVLGMITFLRSRRKTEKNEEEN